MQDPWKSCGNCGSEALIRCHDCGILVYCGRECEASHMPVHSTICKELELERAMIRTADTIRKAYFAFRAPLFEKFIVKIEERDRELVLHQNNTKSGKDNGWFANFPSHLITDKEIEEAVLCFLMGREPLAYLLDLIQYLTGGKVRALLNMNQAKQIRPSSQGGGGPSET
jgi:hypothetical protein